MDLSDLSNLAIQAALQAGELLRKGFSTTYKISSKSGKQNLVTEYDNAAEKCIMDAISKQFPDHQFLAEESGASGAKKAPVLWIIDPLDGTVNFAHKVPVFSVSIAAAINNEVVCGVVYQPMTHELFTAIKGRGSYLNGTKLQVTGVKEIEEAFMATGFPYNVDEDPFQCIEHLGQLLRLGVPVRRLGSAAIDLSYLAAGRYDAYWEVTLKPWDIAAGQLIAEEAGAKVTLYSGKQRDLFSSDNVLATNSLLHDKMIKLLGEPL